MGDSVVERVAQLEEAVRRAVDTQSRPCGRGEEGGAAPAGAGGARGPPAPGPPRAAPKDPPWFSGPARGGGGQGPGAPLWALRQPPGGAGARREATGAFEAL